MSTLAIVHYHLHRGGVTQVVRNQLRALQATSNPFERIVLIHGGRADDWTARLASDFRELPLTHFSVPALEYDNRRRMNLPLNGEIEGLASDLAQAVQRAGGSVQETLLHVHNHALGKNRALPGAIAHLARTGWRCLLQIHDFAEDLRPEAYRYLADQLTAAGKPSLAAQLYPQAPQIHYALLNRRDFKVLRRAGVPASRLHYLPNPVQEPPRLPDQAVARRKLDPALSPARRVVLYPVRGIRRKNIGELLLWAAAFGDTTSFVLSLAPANPDERPIYEQFVRLARELRLPVYFDTGAAAGLSWSENVAACDAMLTTSVAEGFGMVFLESWLAGRPLSGRDLPEITQDFRAAGLDLSGLSPNFQVPLQWPGRSAVVSSLCEAFRDLVRAYGRTPPSTPQLERRLTRLVGDSVVDFARLSPKLQAAVVRRVVDDPAQAVSVLRELNPWLAEAGRVDKLSGGEVVTHNARTARRSYGLTAIGRRLNEAYTSLRAARVAETLEPLDQEQAVLESFIEIERLYPIRFA